MEIIAGKTAVVTGAASGIGLGLAEAFARAGLNVVLADVDSVGLAAAVESVRAIGVEAHDVTCDVSDEDAVGRLASEAEERFGGVEVLCNNAGVSSQVDAWTGPMSSWTWVMGVNFWGVLHGVRAFLPGMLERGSGYIVNTASIAGLYPGFGGSYDASKHAVVALSDDLFRDARQAGWPIGVSVLCPGWVRTGILDAARNWPSAFGEVPSPPDGTAIITKYVRRAIDEGTTPAAIADFVLDAVRADRFWVLPHPEFVELCVKRWQDIAEGVDPVLFRDVPGLPPIDQLVTEMLESLAAGGDGAATEQGQ